MTTPKVPDQAELHAQGRLPRNPRANVAPVSLLEQRRQRGTPAKALADWEVGLLRRENGEPKRCLANVMHVLALHPEWSGVLAHDAFAETPVTLKPPPCREQDRPLERETGDWTEEDSVRTAAWLASIGIDANVETVTQAVVTIARRCITHPVREYLSALTWDGVPRLDSMLAAYFGAQDSAYTRAIGSRWMISAVARVMRPGCQADCVLVLESPEQGIGKSTAIRELAGGWSADTGINVGDKDSYQALRRVWVYEFAELASIRGREAERVKNFLSSRQDHYRPSYGRATRDFPRQCVFVGSTNESHYLVDRTGNRRFWPVQCSAIDVQGIGRDRDELWAEAVARFHRGEAWHVDSGELRRLCEAEQAERETADDWIPIVEAWLGRPTVPDGLDSRRVLDLGDGLSTADVLLGAINLRAGDISQAASTRAGHVLRALGFEPKQRRESGERVRRYFRRPSQVTASTEGSDSSGCDGVPASKTLDSYPSHPSHPHVYTYAGGEARSAGENPRVGKPGVPAVTCDGYSRPAVEEGAS